MHLEVSVFMGRGKEYNDSLLLKSYSRKFPLKDENHSASDWNSQTFNKTSHGEFPPSLRSIHPHPLPFCPPVYACKFMLFNGSVSRSQNMLTFLLNSVIYCNKSLQLLQHLSVIVSSSTFVISMHSASSVECSKIFNKIFAGNAFAISDLILFDLNLGSGTVLFILEWLCDSTDICLVGR